MSLKSSRASRAVRAASGAAGVRRTLVAVVLSLGLLVTTAACGMNVQTLQPYTPGEGVNVDVSNSGNADDVVHVRNLAIISREDGAGILTGSLIGSSADAMTEVTGTAIKVDGTNGSAISAEIAQPVEVGEETIVVLTSLAPLITMTSADITPGLEAVLTLQFRNAGQTTIRVPVVDGNQPPYTGISATPSPTPSASPSASESSPTPAPTPE